MNRRLLLAACIAACLSPPALGAEDAKPAADEATRNAALEKSLSNSALVGQFSVSGREDGKLAPERYELGEVKHLKGDQWLIQARIRYGQHDLPIPLVLPIRWAGDTPVITVDDVSFPGMGTYTARVMIYRDHYAGFWTGKDHGGNLFGVIERGKPESASKKGQPEEAKEETKGGRN